MHKFTKKTMAVSVTAALFCGAGGAYAYWTNTGSGSGTAATGSNVAVAIVQTSTPTGMYPGGPAQPLSGNFNNPNAGNTYVTEVTATGYTIDAGHPGCTVLQGNYTLGGTSNLPADVAAGNGVGAWSGLTITMNNLVTNQDACKGAVVTVTYAST